MLILWHSLSALSIHRLPCTLEVDVCPLKKIRAKHLENLPNHYIKQEFLKASKGVLNIQAADQWNTSFLGCRASTLGQQNLKWVRNANKNRKWILTDVMISRAACLSWSQSENLINILSSGYRGFTCVSSSTIHTDEFQFKAAAFMYLSWFHHIHVAEWYVDIKIVQYGSLCIM